MLLLLLLRVLRLLLRGVMRGCGVVRMVVLLGCTVVVACVLLMVVRVHPEYGLRRARRVPPFVRTPRLCCCCCCCCCCGAA